MLAFKAAMGGVIQRLGFDKQLERCAKEIGRFESKILWAHRRGMDFPPYFLAALRESVELYRAQGSFARA